MENKLYSLVDNSTESEREQNNEFLKFEYNEFSRLKSKLSEIDKNLKQLSTVCLGHKIYKIYKLTNENFLVSKNFDGKVEFYKCNGDDGILQFLNEN